MSYNKQYHYVGIDVAKQSLQIHTGERNESFAYNKDSLPGILEKIARFDSPLVALEPTGGYERKLVDALDSAGIAYHLVDTRRVKGFAASEGTKAKTDPIDAQLLSRFAKEKKLQPSAKPNATQKQVAELLDRRAHLSDLIAREKNRLQKARETTAPLIRSTLDHAKEQIDQVDKLIRQRLAEDREQKQRSQALQSICGVGEVTAWSVIAYMGQIETMGRNQLVALTGLAPFNRDSGNKKGKRYIQCGKAKVRKALYMAARTAATHNKVIREQVDRLLNESGKPYNVAITAAMRKLIIHMQSVLKKLNLQLA
ncbi:IS110 family transposase [Pelagicoccus mobilis]|uniref:IS110 family transposase n=1 Tax=Pelagicoccus mobilis TaxID=415221 RepID=A0A934S368_9BACT|nr:IS110 family transposase [Pelagicoccus mobilis]MBK1878208.1 IS110 family transposase [Pelagicoccus mobilis]